MEALSDKILIMIVGPSAIGKSTIMTAATELRDDFSYVRAFTTRTERPGDQGTYDYISKEEAEALQANGRAVTYVTFPTTGMIYGTTVKSYQTRYNLLDTLANSVETYRRLPFERTVTISLTTRADTWQQWFLARYPEPTDDAQKRLEEAKLSISWSLAQDHDHHWLINQPEHTRDVAQALIQITTDATEATETPTHPHDILELIDRGVWS